MTPHFTFAEAIRTRTGLANMPTPQVAAHIGVTAMHLEGVRSLLQTPIVISSWYRSPTVNKTVGGSISSDHMNGHAVDFVCPDFGTPYDVASRIYASDTKFDQLILEYGWVHLSFAPAMRNQVLTKKSASSAYIRGLVK